MKIIFMGTPKFSAYILAELIKSKHEVVAAVTKEDKKRTRGNKADFSEVKSKAIENNIEALQPAKLKDDDFIDRIKQLSPDIIVTAAYGKILPKEILDIPKYKCINVHASLLPKYRGASPIQHCLINGDKETGITIIQMDEGMDTGDILLKESLEIAPDDTSDILFDKLAVLGAKVLLECLDLIASDQVIRIKQDSAQATYTGMIDKEVGHIDWSMDAEKIVNYVRAISCYFYYNDVKIKLLKASVYDMKAADLANGTIIEADSKKGLIIKCGNGAVEILKLQVPGKKPFDSKAYINGYRPKINDILN